MMQARSKLIFSQSAVEGKNKFSGATYKHRIERTGSQLAADGDFSVTDGAGSSLYDGFLAASFMSANHFDREVYLNGMLLLEGADAADNEDWYEGSGTNVKFEFAVEVGDILTFVYRTHA